MNKAPNFPLRAALGLIFLGAAMPLRAQGIDSPDNRSIGADLTVCNHGSVAVEVVAATRGNDLLRGLDKYFWVIEGATVSPRECTVVNHQNENPSYVAFGVTESNEGWASGTMAPIPDLGSIRLNIFSNEEKVLSGATKGMCARKGATYYVLDDEFAIDCAHLTLTGAGLERGQGPPLALTSALIFHSDIHMCGYRMSANTPYGPYECEATHYYLNISPSATDRELHAMPGSKSGADGAPVVGGGGSGDARVLKALAKAILEEHEKQVKAAADSAAAEERRLREQAAAREEKQKQILAADSAGNPDAKVAAQMIRRDQEDSRKRWAGTCQSAGVFDPQWMGQTMVITGTVSRVDVDTKGSPEWVTIYFKESPDATFVVCSPYADLFQERVGLNLSALVGKTFEAAGEIESPMCGPNAAKGSIRLVESKQWQIH